MSSKFCSIKASGKLLWPVKNTFRDKTQDKTCSSLCRFEWKCFCSVNFKFTLSNLSIIGTLTCVCERSCFHAGWTSASLQCYTRRCVMHMCHFYDRRTKYRLAFMFQWLFFGTICLCLYVVRAKTDTNLLAKLSKIQLCLAEWVMLESFIVKWVRTLCGHMGEDKYPKNRLDVN